MKKNSVQNATNYMRLILINVKKKKKLISYIKRLLSLINTMFLKIRKTFSNVQIVRNKYQTIEKKDTNNFALEVRKTQTKMKETKSMYLLRIIYKIKNKKKFRKIPIMM